MFKILLIIGAVCALYLIWVSYLNRDLQEFRLSLDKPLNQTANLEIVKTVIPAFSVNDSYQQSVYKSLEVELRSIYPNDARVNRFLELNKAMSDLMRKTVTFENGGDLNTYLNMSPTETLTEYVSLSIDLFQLDDMESRGIRKALSGWVDIISILQFANENVPIVQEALNSGKITTEEAELFFKEIYGVDAKIESIEISK